MPRRADTTVIRVDDPNCKGVTSPDGRKEYPADDKGRIELPKYEAKRILNSGHRDVHKYRPTVGLGVGVPGIEIEYEQWRTSQPEDAPFVSYVQWYQEIRGREEHVG